MGDNESINVRLARVEEIQKAHDKKIGEMEKSLDERFASTIKALNGVFDRLVILEKWTWMTLGACGLLAFAMPFVIKVFGQKL